jgi:uncharacterized cupredoxin-like copper-binding protein
MVIGTSAFAHDHARRQSWSAGEPGDSKKPARTIEIVMSEMAYEPGSIEVKRGEQIRFVIRNAGTEDHIPAGDGQGKSGACGDDEEASSHEA